MKVSVIVPTFNGRKKIPLVLNALKWQSYQPDEIIIAIDGSNDNTLEILNGLKPEIPSMRVLYQENRGRAAIRNFGVKNATGDLLIFCDDDMRPAIDWVAAHVNHHKKFPNSIFTGTQFEETGPKTRDFARYKSYLGYKWTRSYELMENMAMGKENIFITAANFSIPKSLYLELGGFDDRLTDTEDYDLATRAFKSGINLYFGMNASAWHDDTGSCKCFIKRQRQYVTSRKNLINLKPWLVTEGFLQNDFFPSKIKRIFFRLFAFPCWINAVESGRFKLLPQNIKYRLYDLIVTSNGVYYPEKVKL